MSRLVETGAPVLSFCMAGNDLYLLYGTELAKADKRSGDMILKTTVFAKEGKARLIRGNPTLLAVSDFCDLLLFRQDTLQQIGEWKLGSDLSSDICGFMMDEAYVYAGIRNDKITRISLSDFSQASFSIGSASSWALATWNNHILAGTVDGKLLCFDRHSMKCENSLSLSKQNLRSLYVDGDTLYAASQDKKLYRVDLPSFTCTAVRNHLHGKMFDIAGVRDGEIVTLSHPAGEIRVWRGDGSCALEQKYPLRLSGSSLLDGERLLLSSRSIPGVDAVSLPMKAE